MFILNTLLITNLKTLNQAICNTNSKKRSDKRVTSALVIEMLCAQVFYISPNLCRSYTINSRRSKWGWPVTASPIFMIYNNKGNRSSTPGVTMQFEAI